MGDIADGMVDGDLCAICAMPFEKEHGYPVACRDCWTKDCGYQKAIFKTCEAPDA